MATPTENPAATEGVSAPAGAQTQTPPVSTPTPPATTSAKEIFAKMSPEERRLAVTGKFDQIKPAAPVAKTEPTPAAPAPVTPAAAPATPAPEPTPTAAPSATTEPASTTPAAEPRAIEEEIPDLTEQTSGSKSKRFRLADEKDQALVMFAKANGLSLIEAAQRMAPQPQQSAMPQPAASQTTPAAPAPSAQAVDPEVADYDARISAAQKRITDLTEARKKANEDLDNAKVLELTDQIADAKLDARALDNEKKGFIRNREQSAQRSVEQQLNASRDRAFSEYPMLADRNSVNGMALDTYANRQFADPNRHAQLAADPNWPEKITREFAELVGIKPKGEAAGTAPAPAAPAAAPATKPVTLPKAQPVQVAQQPQGARLLSGSNGQQPSAPRTMTREELLNLVRTDPSARKEIKQVIFKPNRA